MKKTTKKEQVIVKEIAKAKAIVMPKKQGGEVLLYKSGDVFDMLCRVWDEAIHCSMNAAAMSVIDGDHRLDGVKSYKTHGLSVAVDVSPIMDLTKLKP